MQADEQLILGLIENLQRTDLNPVEEAHGLRKLTEDLGLTHEEVAQRIGKNRVSVTQSIRMEISVHIGPAAPFTSDDLAEGASFPVLLHRTIK